MPKYAFTRLDTLTTEPGILSRPDVAAVLESNHLVGAATPTAPVYQYHGIFDEVVPIADTDNLVGTYCAAGARVTYVRDPLGEHARSR